MEPVKPPPARNDARRVLTIEERQAISRQRREERIRAEQIAATTGRAIDERHVHASRATLPDKRPLAGRNQLSAADRAAHLDALESLGIRQMPYGAGSIVAIVSDVDGSTRERYGSYIGQLVDRAGLDFGDSTWLTPQFIYRETDGPVGVGFGFFHRKFDFGYRATDRTFEYTRTFRENLIEFHLGNVDHFHSFLPNGPRMVLVTPATIEDTLAVFKTGTFALSGFSGCKNLCLTGVCVIGRRGESLDVATVTVEADSAIGPYLETSAWRSNERRFVTFEAARDADADVEMPDILSVKDVSVQSSTVVAAESIEYIVLMNASSAIMRDRLSLLHRDYNVESSLVTDHSGFHFRDWSTAPKRDELLAKIVRDHEDDALHAIHGTCNDADGVEIFNTEADSADSLTGILGPFVDDLGGAYVVPAGGVAASQDGWSLLDLVTPATTRSGGSLYVAQRTIPPPADQLTDRVKSHASTLAPRITRILDCASEAPGSAWPLYTHVGGIPTEHGPGKIARRKLPPPDPYFERGPIDRLQDAAFGITGVIASKARVWFTRATSVYDYALMLRSLPANTKRSDADTVEIASWTDRILDQVMPRSPAMLNGVTFYCDDPARAEVRLDGRALAVARNPADETGRASVTVAETDLRFGVFSRLDPARRSPDDAQVDGGAWDWHGDHGSLVPCGSAPASLRIALNDWHPVGSQAVSFALRRSPGSVIGVLVETATGGRFFFGDAVLCPPDVEAQYALDRHAAPAGEWRTIIVPFTDLDWRAGAAPGGPMPSHPLTAITLISHDAPAEFADVAFLRPRSTRLSQREAPRFCLAGTVPDFTPGQSVDLTPAEGDGETQHCVVDQRGAFCFTGLAAGIYQLSTDTPAGRLVDRRGELVEVTGDIATIALVRDA